jgi:hypothetical protein
MNFFLIWTSSGKEKIKWVNKTSLVGMFEIEWITPHHNILVQFLNNQKLDTKHNRIKVMMAEELKIYINTYVGRRFLILPYR